MKDSLFTKMALIVAVILLFLNLIGLVYSPSSSYAARSYRYKVIPYIMGTKNLQDELNKLGAEGWEFVAVEAQGHLIFKK